MTIGFYTLGCKVNQFETQAMESEFLRRGHEAASFDDRNDIYVINTCSVTAVSDKKSRQAMRRARRLNPNAVIAVCGCYPQASRDEIEKLDVDVVGGTGDRLGFVELVLSEAARKRSGMQIALDDVMARRIFEALPAGSPQSRTRALLKVQDGCVNFCAYCVIPKTRGPVRSMPLVAALSEAARMEREGFKELVITGIEISSYGRDFKDGTGLADLIAGVCRTAPGLRIRLGSLEPRTVTEEFCQNLSGLENLCPHFHLSLQSGCDETLKRMRRKYDTGRFLKSADLLRAYFPGCAVTTDLIVGFPGETEAEFSQTMDFIEARAFASVHVFPYSKRPGTPAAEMDLQIPNAEKQRRAKAAGQLAARMKREYLLSCVGKRYPVLFEQEKNGRAQGHAPNYALVTADAPGLDGQIRQVRILSAGDGVLNGCVE